MQNPNDLREAEFVDYSSGVPRCELCPHLCSVASGAKGFCGVRRNYSGKLYSMNFSSVSSLALDPIEKKPLYHYYPSSQILSAGTYGCNMNCMFCQNYSISRADSFCGQVLSPDDLVSIALEKKSFAIAYTYSEPIVWYEYVRQTAALARGAGLKNVMVSNGMICSKPLERILPLIDAWNIDLKAFREASYRQLGGDLTAVKRTIEICAGASHVEITSLAVTDFNDSIDEFSDIAMWIASIDKNIPWHISRYFPAYRYDRKPTSVSFLKDAYLAGKRHLNHVYVGNLTDSFGQDTVCPDCGKIMIERKGYGVTNRHVKDGLCSLCGAYLNIVDGGFSG